MTGRPRTRDPEEKAPRQYVGGPIPRSLKQQLQQAAKTNGRSLNAEWISRLEASFQTEAILDLIATRFCKDTEESA